MTRIKQQPQQPQQGQQPHHPQQPQPHPATDSAFKAPTWWSWIVFWVVNKLHIGFPLFNALLGYKVQWTPEEMEDKTGQVGLASPPSHVPYSHVLPVLVVAAFSGPCPLYPQPAPE